MAKFVWQPPGQEPLAFAIRQERVAIGRDAGNDIRLPESAVSARHAVVITRGGVTTLHDLNSSNGTWINGKRVESQPLKHGDTVQFGRLSMSFIDESQATQEKPAIRTSNTARNVTISLGRTGHATADDAATQRRPAQPPDGPDLSELDRLLGSIRSFRDEEQKQQELKRQALLEEWKKTLEYAAAVKTKLSAEKRIRFFDVSERRNEVVIRIERSPGQPTQLLMVTWGHMEARERQEGIWLRLPGQPDKRYEKCSDVMRDLVAMIAHLLA